MQSFLPFWDFEQTAALLDPRRLGKRRVEVLQICDALHRASDGWVNHPVTRMWRDYEPALVAYGLAIVRESMVDAPANVGRRISRGDVIRRIIDRSGLFRTARLLLGNAGFPTVLGSR